MAQTTARAAAHKLGKPVSDYVDTVLNQYPAVGVPSEFILKNTFCAPVAGSALTEDTAYFVFVGRTSRRITANKIKFHVTTGGTGAQTAAEVGLFSTPTAPNGAGQVLTKLAATGTLGDLTGTGVLGNTTNFAYDVPAGTYLWLGIRTAMATNEPVLFSLGADCSMGTVLSTATAGALTASSTFTGALITAAVTFQAPGLFLHCA